MVISYVNSFKTNDSNQRKVNLETPENNITRCYNLIYKNTLYMALLSLDGHLSTLTFRYHIFKKYRNDL